MTRERAHRSRTGRESQREGDGIAMMRIIFLSSAALALVTVLARPAAAGQVLYVTDYRNNTVDTVPPGGALRASSPRDLANRGGSRSTPPATSMSPTSVARRSVRSAREAAPSPRSQPGLTAQPTLPLTPRATSTCPITSLAQSASWDPAAACRPPSRPACHSRRPRF